MATVNGVCPRYPAPLTTLMAQGGGDAIHVSESLGYVVPEQGAPAASWSVPGIGYGAQPAMQAHCGVLARMLAPRLLATCGWRLIEPVVGSCFAVSAGVKVTVAWTLETSASGIE